MVHFNTRLAMVVHVAASQQVIPLPPAPERDASIRRAFFARLSTGHQTEFAFVGTELGRVALAASAAALGFSQREAHRESDLTVAYFEANDRSTAMSGRRA